MQKNALILYKGKLNMNGHHSLYNLSYILKLTHAWEHEGATMDHEAFSRDHDNTISLSCILWTTLMTYSNGHRKKHFQPLISHMRYFFSWTHICFIIIWLVILGFIHVSCDWNFWFELHFNTYFLLHCHCNTQIFNMHPFFTRHHSPLKKDRRI